MDTMDYTTAGVRRIKGIQHLSNWKLILLVFLLTSYTTCDTTPSTPEVFTKQMKHVTACEGGTGLFPWKDDTQEVRRVEYVFKSSVVAKSSSPHFSSVVFKDDRLKSRLVVLKDNNVAFRIDNVRDEDRGEYKIALILTNGDRKELVGHLDLRDYARGNLPITCDPIKNDQTICNCGGKIDSGPYTWVFSKTTPKTTDESELTLSGSKTEGSVFCKRHFDCQRSQCYYFTDEIEIGDYNVTVTNTEGNCRTLKCGEPVGTQTKYVWLINVTGKVEETTTTTNTYNLCRSDFDCSVKCQRDHDCTETPWMCFMDTTGKRRQKRSLDKQLYPCGGNQDSGEDQDSDGDQDSGNPEHSSTNTTVIAVSVVITVIVVIAVVTTVVIWRRRKSRDEQRPTTTEVEMSTRSEANSLVDITHQPDNDNSERTNLNQAT